MKSPTGFESSAPLPSSEDLAGALHEVSNALTVVVGWLDKARTLVPPGRARDAMEVAVEHARRGHAIARRSIGAPQIGAAGARSAISIARDAATGVAQEAAHKRVQVVVDDEGASDLLVSHSPVAMQILINLLLNAVAFSNHGSRVTLRLRNLGADLEFSVRDQGAGIAPDRISGLFDSPVSTRSGGAGIGLRHSHALALEHGGELRLADTGPEGTKFALMWPVADAPSAAVHRTVPPRALDGVRLLVLEDDPAVGALIEFGLSNRGAAVTAVATTQDLFRALGNGIFDTLLVDLSPLKEDPGAVLAQIHALRPGLPVVIISGSVAPDVPSREVAAWVRKPFEVPELVDVLNRISLGG